MAKLSPDMISRFRDAVTELEALFLDVELTDENADDRLRHWLDGNDAPLPWADADRVNPDEWFFVTTFYALMNEEGQRTQIRKYFPTLYVEAAKRDIRNFIPEMPEYMGMRADWMSRRLCQMGSRLCKVGQSMTEYTQNLGWLESSATRDNPTRALDRLKRDHNATGWATLSYFVRDCVGGNCFPIDDRVKKELEHYRLPQDEKHLVSLALAIGRNPRQVNRMFYHASDQRAKWIP
jgi:hypothetical protein